jgi:hypothetical protein
VPTERRQNDDVADDQKHIGHCQFGREMFHFTVVAFNLDLQFGHARARTQACGQNTLTQRFDEVVIGTGLVSLDQQILIAGSGQQKHVHRPPQLGLSQRTDQTHAIDAGHGRVSHQYLRQHIQRRFQRRLSVIDLEGLVAQPLQQGGNLRSLTRHPKRDQNAYAISRACRLRHRLRDQLRESRRRVDR